MVLLTIAISGGPFLGLLGTVIGVMITFAGVAAAGDVNVNAIAPGIAAALVATIAGLAVAIPALFGYNWLITRIKVVSSNCMFSWRSLCQGRRSLRRAGRKTQSIRSPTVSGRRAHRGIGWHLRGCDEDLSGGQIATS